MIQLPGNKQFAGMQIGKDGEVKNVSAIYIGGPENVPLQVWMKQQQKEEIVVTLTEENGTFIVPSGYTRIQAFLVGGGGGGNVGFRQWYSSGGEYVGYDYCGGGGGGGGYTLMTSVIEVKPSQKIEYKVGRGGKGKEIYGYGEEGGDTTFGAFTALGGNKIKENTNWKHEYSHKQYESEWEYTFRLGMPGGSRGGNGAFFGSAGEGFQNGTPTYGENRGQGVSTREFEKADGRLYSTGGDGVNTSPAKTVDGKNYGDGGSGGTLSVKAGNGATGIIIVRCFN